MDEATQALAAETQLKRYGNFVQTYAAELSKIEKEMRTTMYDVWEFPFHAIEIDTTPFEQASLATLVESDNKMLSKILLALGSLCSEMDFLADEVRTKLADPLLFYGEGESDDADEGDRQLSFSRIIPVLQEVSCLQEHSQEVVLNVVHQLSVLHNNAKDGLKLFRSNDVHFQVVFDSLGRLFIALITLDEIVGCNSALREDWTSYKRMLRSAHMDPEKYGANKEKLKLFEQLLARLEENVFGGSILKACIEQQFNKNGIYVTKNAGLCDEFNFCLRTYFTEVDNGFDQDKELRLVGLAGLTALFHNLFQSLDKKFVNRLWDMYKKVPGVALHGNVMWFPEVFFLSTAPNIMKISDKKLVQVLSANRQNYLLQKAQSLNVESKAMTQQLSTWIIRMESNLKRVSDQLTLDDLQRKCDLLIQGVQLASTLKGVLTMILNLSAKLSAPMTKTTVIALCKTAEMVKIVEQMFVRHSVAIADLSGHICQHLQYGMLNVIAKGKRGVVSDKRYNQTRLDILSAILMAENCLSSAPTKSRLMVSRLALAIATQNRTFKDDEISHLVTNMLKLSLVGQLSFRVKRVCDTSFLYFNRVMVSAYFSYLYEHKHEASRLQYIFGALQDCAKPMYMTQHLANQSQLFQMFEEEVKGYLKDQILDPLCRDLETDLRLQAHSHLKLDDRNPFRVGLQDISPFLDVVPFRFMDKYINIKSFVEAYLEKTFYNLTTVALHNWRTYGEMRALAFHKFGAETVDDNLPAQTLEQGLDILEIMRNIHVFVSQYYYNLNNQIFVQRSSENKHLNTINIKHIANSIRTHGTGIMNTTVNFTYQFLRKKFILFSQFLYDEHIKSRLIKDVRFFRENQATLEQKYPYDRAHKFNKGIRKLGLLPDGVTTYLDQFRLLISQIGNAMGYVRMVKSGGLHFVSDSIRFVPDLDDIPNFEQLSAEESLSPEAVEAAKVLDSVVENLTKNFSQGTEYFELLVSVFGQQFQDRKHVHLKNFYIIVPPLTINYVENLIAAKERMNKKNKEGAAFTDDGLAMGIAYVLRLLDQGSAFDSLHWFQAVRERYALERASVEKQRAKASDDKLQQTLALTLKRLDTYQREFDLLFYGLSSARIFFRAGEQEGVDEDDETKSTASAKMQ